MAQGLQVFDSNGVCVLDITDRLTRTLGTFSTGNNYNESIFTSEALIEAAKYNSKIWCIPLEIEFPTGVYVQDYCFPLLSYSNGRIVIKKSKMQALSKQCVSIKFLYGSM